MSGGDEVDIFKELTSELGGLKVDVRRNNQKVGDMMVSSDIIAVHNLIKDRKLIYGIKVSPPGKWSWDGLREIRKKSGSDDSRFTLPDGVSTFYGAFNYNYVLQDEDGKNKTICHDVVSMSPIILDAKPRSTPKNSNSGVYGVDWWNIYIPLKLVQKIADDIRTTSGYILNNEGIIKDSSQNLVSVTINIRDESKSPHITMVTLEDVNDGDETLSSGSKSHKLVQQDLGKLSKIISEGGEEALIGGVGFLSIGVSCKSTSGAEPPPAGTHVKLSVKMKAFHALDLIDEGISRITYSSKGDNLSYG